MPTLRQRPPLNARPIPKLKNTERQVVPWNERQARQLPLLFAPTIGAAITASYWFLRVRCPACRTTQSVELRSLDRHCCGAKWRCWGHSDRAYLLGNCTFLTSRNAISTRRNPIQIHV